MSKKKVNDFFVKGPRGDITFTILDKEYTIIPTFLVLSEIEKRLQKSIISICEEFYDNKLTVYEMSTIIWCGFKFHKSNKLEHSKIDLSPFSEDLITLGVEKIHSLVGSLISEYFIK